MIAAGAAEVADIRVGNMQAIAVYAGEELVWEAVPAYLTFSSPSAFTLTTANETKNWDGVIEYSTNKSTWIEWDGKEIASLNVGAKYRLYLRGKNNHVITGNVSANAFVLSGSQIECDGDIRTLLDYDDMDDASMDDYCFAYLFQSCAALTKAPDLPLTTLTVGCYTYMFHGCGLIRPPSLPATVLQQGCYSRMFGGCQALTEAPLLPAMSVPQSAYFGMFSSCYSLVRSPSLPATTVGKTCYDQMFEGCRNLETIPRLPALVLADMCYLYMFSGCSKIKISEAQTGEYVNEYRIPASGTGQNPNRATRFMFGRTGGTFTGDPAVNTMYYTSNLVI